MRDTSIVDLKKELDLLLPDKKAKLSDFTKDMLIVVYYKVFDLLHRLNNNVADLKCCGNCEHIKRIGYSFGCKKRGDSISNNLTTFCKEWDISKNLILKSREV